MNAAATEDQNKGVKSVAEDGEQGDVIDTCKDDVEADDAQQQREASTTSEDEEAVEPHVAALRETYTHEKLCMIRFLRDDLGNGWHSVARMYNWYWYPDHPKGVYKDALYSRYEKEVPKDDRGNAGMLGADDDWEDESEQNNEATCIVENGNTINQGDAMDTSKDDDEADDTLEQGDASDTSEDEDEDEEPPAPRRLGALTLITAALAVILI
ncbi:hypothetical protein BZA05DRAFT_442285 [Tricharina praecox]|uniref:uncharacterized protein n=1 Tax=Tricharina praecox TaxID=43433 RepID=UPI00221F8F9A|nr:uncharacterized protein BZA05DRAFT_442285 [Tricharina praecox]KAI5856602.1 hypothetical protein BZA05DRAFT_442285 [Tricharina praecox]